MQRTLKISTTQPTDLCKVYKNTQTLQMWSTRIHKLSKCGDAHTLLLNSQRCDSGPIYLVFSKNGRQVVCFSKPLKNKTQSQDLIVMMHGDNYLILP